MDKKNIFLLFLILIINYFIFSGSKLLIGYSVNKEEISLFSYGYGKELLIIASGLHGDDINGVNAVLYLKELLDNNKIFIPDDKLIWLIPLVNPDGYNKNVRANVNKVDLNRNFTTEKWSSKIFFKNIILNAGKTSFSEPETVALKNLFDSIDNNFSIILLEIRGENNFILPASWDVNDLSLANFISGVLESKVRIDLNSSGKFIKWVKEKYKISSVTIYLNEYKKIESLIPVLLKEKFRNKFYLNEPIFDKKIEGIVISTLPEEVKRIIESTNSREKFIKLLFNTKNEFLILVNKTHKLPEEYSPEDLIEVDSNFIINGKKIFIREVIKQDLYNMIEDAKKEGVYLKILSGYRSFETQKKIFEEWVIKLGENEAKRVSAQAGESQHQLGTTIDFNSLDFSFANTKEGKWLYLNSYKYGFILSYPQNMEHITGYRYEPWHYRYVGKEAAVIIYNFFGNSLDLFLDWYWNNVAFD